MPVEPDPVPESVTDEESFLAFVRALAADRTLAAEEEKRDAGYGAPRRWQSSTIEQFLEGAIAWAEESGFGRRQGLGDEVSPWRRFAVFLYAGKIYE